MRPGTKDFSRKKKSSRSPHPLIPSPNPHLASGSLSSKSRAQTSEVNKLHSTHLKINSFHYHTNLLNAISSPHAHTNQLHLLKLIQIQFHIRFTSHLIHKNHKEIKNIEPNLGPLARSWGCRVRHWALGSASRATGNRAPPPVSRAGRAPRLRWRAPPPAAHPAQWEEQWDERENKTEKNKRWVGELRGLTKR
jgi:hypothetical protein